MTRATAQCIHHWRIEIPDGPTSTGICRRCGATREFKNYLETSVGEERMRLGIYMSDHRLGMPREVWA